MRGLNTIGELNEAATKSHEKAAWPDPIPAGEAKPVNSHPGGGESLPDTPAISQVEQ